MTNQERLDEAKRLLATGKHQDRKEAKRLLLEIKRIKKTAAGQQSNLF